MDMMDNVVVSVLNMLSRRLMVTVVVLLCSTRCLTSLTPTCVPVTLPQCTGVVNTTLLPNIYGHFTETDVDLSTSQIFKLLGSECPSLTRFLCVLHLPPCPDPSTPIPTPGTLLPCRQVCEGGKGECPALLDSTDGLWSNEVQCQNFPTENCLMINDLGIPVFVETSLRATNTPKQTNNQPELLAPLEAEIGDNDEYAIEIVSMSSNQIPQRRYDVIELGDENLFHGWADIQGIGAANDYCRVLGRGRRRFLSCALAGSSGQAHHYVSKLGFDLGHRNTWFMRDVDNDGRDDYCRCVGRTDNSRISCMKAGEKAFYGSTVQGGSQYSFDLPGSNGCHDKRLNPQFGA